jgi:hypothetical protein
VANVPRQCGLITAPDGSCRLGVTERAIPLLTAKELAFPREGAARGPRCPENEGHDQKRAEQRTGSQAGNG